MYIENYFHADDHHSRLIDYGMIKNKVAIWVGMWDQVCNIAHTDRLRVDLGDKLSHYAVYPWHGHGTLAIMADFDFHVDDAIAALDYPEGESGFIQ